MRKYEKTIDVKTAIESLSALFVVEKMSMSSVRDRPLESLSALFVVEKMSMSSVRDRPLASQKSLSVHHRY